MNRVNYDKRMQEEIASLRGDAPPRLLLHACCAPCSSACLERLRQDFRITVFYYNPNIDEETEYRRRAAEERRLIEALNRQARGQGAPGTPPADAPPRQIDILEGDYRPGDFYEAIRGLEDAPEGGARCERCFTLRLHETARVAREGGFDYFTTTLTISPLKDAALLNRIGAEAGRAQGVRWLPSDFKKRDGFRRSVQLSEQFDLYRQDYCGCSFSIRGSDPTPRPPG